MPHEADVGQETEACVMLTIARAGTQAADPSSALNSRTISTKKMPKLYCMPKTVAKNKCSAGRDYVKGQTFNGLWRKLTNIVH
jgi:hypothetical protein